MLTISKPINGNPLNGDEWLTNEDGTKAEFMNELQVAHYLLTMGLSMLDVNIHNETKEGEEHGN